MSKKKEGLFEGWDWRFSAREHDEATAIRAPLRLPAGICGGRRPLCQFDRSFAVKTFKHHKHDQVWGELLPYRDPEDSAETYIEWVERQPSRQKARNATTKKRHQSPKKRKAPH